MQYRRQHRIPPKSAPRRRLARWVIPAAFALAGAVCIAAVWFAWIAPTLQPAPSETGVSQAPSAVITPVVTATAAATPSPSPSPVPTPTETPLPQAAACSPGDTGEDVKLLQTVLTGLGFDPGEADGVYGGALTAAVQNFQLYAGLTVDGIAGDQTAQALTQRWQAMQQSEPAAQQPLSGLVIGIDPGHQRTANVEQEPIAPGSSVMKDKVSSGTEGQFTGVPEYVVNLQVALKLKAALEALGAKVVMTRETHGVDIANVERALMMNAAGVDCWLRIHANYSPDADNHGMFILVPPEGGLDTDDPAAVEQSVALAQALLSAAVASTGAEDDGLSVRDDQTGFGWSQVPVCNIEMGYMSNEEEDRLLVTEAYQQKIVDGLVAGFVAYFSGI
jgi:N-acetylmuramoyl-L-alanine amidase